MDIKAKHYLKKKNYLFDIVECFCISFGRFQRNLIKWHQNLASLSLFIKWNSIGLITINCSFYIVAMFRDINSNAELTETI